MPVFNSTEYVSSLCGEVEKRVRMKIMTPLSQQGLDAPPPLSSQYERPDKQQAIKSHKSRFSLGLSEN